MAIVRMIEHEDRIALALLIKDMYERAVREGHGRTAQHLREALEMMVRKGNSNDTSQTTR